MIVVDSSIWIECFRNPQSPWSQVVRRSVEEDQAVCNGIILCEILQGAKTDLEFKKLKSHLDILIYREVARPIWDLAGEISYQLRLKRTVVPLSDCIIAAACIHYKDQILTLDKHFVEIAKHFPFKVRCG